MTLLNMMKKWFLFLIALIATGTLGVLYSIFEVHILQSLSTWPKSTQPQNILRISLGVASLLILALSYWASELKSQLKNVRPDKTLQVAAPPSPTHLSPKAKTKEITIDGIIWSATKTPPPLTRLFMDEDARCAQHDLKLLSDQYNFFCPDYKEGSCKLTISKRDFYKKKEAAESRLDKMFRDDPPPSTPRPSQPSRPKSNWVMGWRR